MGQYYHTSQNANSILEKQDRFQFYFLFKSPETDRVFISTLAEYKLSTISLLGTDSSHNTIHAGHFALSLCV